jgi:hypothetical protein
MQTEPPTPPPQHALSIEGMAFSLQKAFSALDDWTLFHQASRNSKRLV